MIQHAKKKYFYPRSPCGERPANAVDQILPGHISIHALLAESDEQSSSYSAYLEISIHALLAESDQLKPPVKSHAEISIHALLAESDKADSVTKWTAT